MMPVMSSTYLHTAIRAAREAGRIQQFHAGSSELQISTKSSRSDLVTMVDRLCEERIREVIGSAHPDHQVLGEELGQQGGESDYRWIVDPLDGTLNYAHGFPFYCVSIALEVRGELQVGVVFDSNRNELFTAVRGGGAYLNGAPLRVTAEADPADAMLATGFAYLADAIVDNVAVFGRVLPQVRSIRRPGAAALDLSYLAAGRLDGFWELTLSPWDVAAGVLIVREAGGVVTGPQGEEYSISNPQLVASNGPLHEPLLKLLQLGN
jgi:myo-inositol-1(or 4)-monophosphatase